MILEVQAKAGKRRFTCNTKAEAQSRQAENILCLKPDPFVSLAACLKAESYRRSAVVAQVSGS